MLVQATGLYFLILCKSVTEVFSDRVGDNYGVRTDYNNVSKIVESTVCEGLSAVASGVNELREYVTAIQQSLEGLKCGNGNLRFNGTCYSTPHVSASRDLSHRNADVACRKQGAKLAEIHDRTQQQMLEDFIRLKIPSSLSAMDFWIGMTKDGNVVRYESGKEVPLNHFVWLPLHPQTRSDRTLFLLNIKRSGVDGIWNYKEWNANGVICEKVL